MKTLISFFVATFMYVSTIFAVVPTAFQKDSALVSNWAIPTFGNCPTKWNIVVPNIDTYPRATAIADSIGNFDSNGGNFDTYWTQLSQQGVSGAGYPIAQAVMNPGSNNGPADFTGAYKVAYDANNIYILLKYTDDSYQGTESVEIMWAPDFGIPALLAKLPLVQQNAYARYAQFGGYKATYTPTAFSAAFMIDFTAAGVFNFNWGGTNNILTNNLFVDSKSTPNVGSAGVIKTIYTIGFPALTGGAYGPALNARPNFDTKIWRTINAGKGISFDIKVVDTDANDALSNANPPKPLSTEYWWNSSVNDGWAETYYSGFLQIRPKATTGVESVHADKPAIFGNVNSNQIQLTQVANVEVYNSIGKRVISLKNVNSVDLSNLNKGVYIIRANNETLKFFR